MRLKKIELLLAYITSVRDAVVVLQSMDFEGELAVSWLVNSGKASPSTNIEVAKIKNNMLSKAYFQNNIIITIVVII
ncbi:MAG TPA: hypothetical protein VFI70_01180 [Nitrososphaeraceae archaeon]|nr:hypothetical protein [Nitrososphaeraceae archaeon]